MTFLDWENLELKSVLLERVARGRVEIEKRKDKIDWSD